MAKIKLLFIHSATADMTEAIDFFEQRKVTVHNAAEKLESILVNQMRKVLDDSEIYTVNLDGDKVKKSRKCSVFVLYLFNFPDKTWLLCDNCIFRHGDEVIKPGFYQ